MATHPSILVWRVPWREEPGGLQSIELQRVGHYLATKPPPVPWMSLGKAGVLRLICLGSVSLVMRFLWALGNIHVPPLLPWMIFF